MTQLAFAIMYWGAIGTVAFVVVGSLITKTGIDLLGEGADNDLDTREDRPGAAR